MGGEGALSYPCPHHPDAGLPVPPEAQPALAEQFQVHVEANILQKNSTSEAVEIYDLPNRRAVMSVTTGNRTGEAGGQIETGGWVGR